MTDHREFMLSVFAAEARFTAAIESVNPERWATYCENETREENRLVVYATDFAKANNGSHLIH